MTLFGENYNSAEFMLGLITRAEHCAVVEPLKHRSGFPVSWQYK